LVHLVSLSNEAGEHFGGESKISKRERLFQEMCSHIRQVDQSRLLNLINHGIRWERGRGVPEAGASVDLLTGELISQSADEPHVSSLRRVIKLPTGSYPEAVCFTRDGNYLVTGSSDGLIEVYDPTSGKLATDLIYQREGRFMVHASSVSALRFSEDGSKLASGDKDGDIIVWNFSTGVSIRHIPSAHRGGITGLEFTPDGSGILSSSLDTTARLHGVKSGALLMQYEGHSSFVSSARILASGDIVTGSSDGFVRVFSSNLGRPISSFAPSSFYDHHRSPRAINNLLLNSLPSGAESVIVCPSGSCGYLMTLDGAVLRTFDSGYQNDEIVSVALSHTGRLAYFSSNHGNLFCFSVESGNLMHAISVCKSEINGLAHNPRVSLVAVASADGGIYLIGR
jgi:WD40 repeat-containing protein SMU1